MTASSGWTAAASRTPVSVIAGPVAGYAPVPLALWVRRTGGAPSTTGADPIGHMLHLIHDEPEVARATRWYLEPVDYLSMRFTGTATASHASMTAAWLTDNRHLDRMSYDPELVRRAGLSLRELPPLRPTGSVVGVVQAEARRRARPPARDVQVVTGTPDLHSGAVGAGTVLDYETHLAISTSSWLGCAVPFKKTDVLHSDRHRSRPHAGPLPRRQQPRDRRRVPAVAARPGHRPGRRAHGRPRRARASPSSPRWPRPWRRAPAASSSRRGSRASGHRSTTATRAVGSTTSRSPRPAPISCRAVLEGVAYNSRWLHEAVEKFAKRRLDHVRLIGGGAQSDLWCQIHADVLDRTIERVEDPVDANLRGAALFAGLALGAVRPDEVRGLVPVDAVFRPDPAHRPTYDRLYAEFPKLYKAQKGMFRRLNQP